MFFLSELIHFTLATNEGLIFNQPVEVIYVDCFINSKALKIYSLLKDLTKFIYDKTEIVPFSLSKKICNDQFVIWEAKYNNNISFVESTSPFFFER